MSEHNSVALSYNDEALNELHDATAILHALYTYCQNKEFSSEYYGIPKDYIKMVSEERNEYGSLIKMVTEKVSNIKKLHLCLEKELTLLQKDTNNCCR